MTEFQQRIVRLFAYYTVSNTDKSTKHMKTQKLGTIAWERKDTLKMNKQVLKNQKNF
jgi:hypothetical protein